MSEAQAFAPPASASPEFPPGASNAATDAVILGQRRIASVPTVADLRTAKPKRPRIGKRRAAELAAREEGYSAGWEARGEGSGIWTFAALTVAAVVGAILGAWVG